MKTEGSRRPLTDELLAPEALVQPLGGHDVLHHRDGRQELDRARDLAGDEVRALGHRLGDVTAQDVELLEAGAEETRVRAARRPSAAEKSRQPNLHPGGRGQAECAGPASAIGSTEMKIGNEPPSAASYTARARASRRGVGGAGPSW